MSETAMLDSCRDIVAARLSEDLAQTLTRVVGELAELAGKMPSQEMYSLYMDSMELAREKNAEITAGFKKHFFTRFNEEKRRVRNESGIRNLDLSNLSLLEPDDLEQSLAANAIANAIANMCGEELFGLGKRIGVLLNEPDLKTEQLPLGPDVIGAALLDALKDQNASIKIKLMLVTRINKQFPAKVRGVYQEVNQHLVKLNVLPTIRAGITRTAARPSAPASAQAAASATAGLGADPGNLMASSGEQDMFAMLQQLMAFGRGGAANPAIPGLPMPQALPGSLNADVAAAQSPGQVITPAAMQTMMQTLTQLQHGRLEGLGVDSLNADLIAAGHTNVLRELKNSQAAGMMGQMETMTLDIVVLVFDYILGDNRIPDAMKALIGRLQIPVLKVTMLDKSFFSQKAHPVRRLLDLLAEASLGWDSEEGHDSDLYQTVEQLVQRILNQFDERLDVFSDALNEFQIYLADEKLVSDALTSRSAQFLRNREQLEIARVVAHDAIMTSLLDRPMPASIREFLLNHWKNWLASVYMEKGEGSPDWNDAVATMSDLLWSLTPKTDKEERRKLIELLPRLLKRLDSSINAIGLGKEARDAFFSDLVKCHAVAVKAGFRGEHGDADAAATSDAIPDLSAQESPIFSPQDFEDIPLITEALIPDAALLQEIAAVQEEASDVEEITISGVRGEDWDEPRDSHHETLVKQLKRGTWIEFKQDDGAGLRAKLAWVSPLQGTYLFTNRLGQRAVSINAQGLAAKFREGRAQIIDNVPLIDRAVNNVFQLFQRGA
ncbi:MAG: DUF1631 domain-containing protein [Pseudomonadota bacterium]|nr:DUF1631 domain-containing protein [Pseudomonadota bacterium]